MAIGSVTQTVGSGLPRQLVRPWQQQFRQRLLRQAPQVWLFIGIDVGKYEHVAVACDATGSFVAPPLRFGIRESDYQTLFTWAEALATPQAALLLWAMEPTGHYYELLAQRLTARYPVQQVYLVQTGDVAQRRQNWNQGTFKTDAVDGALISELLRQGHGRPYQPAVGAYLQLYHLERYRLAREQASTRLKNQILGHVDRLYPGLIIGDDALAARYAPLFRDLWAQDTPQRLLLLYPEPQALHQATAASLYDRFRAAGYWMSRPYAAKIVAAVQALALPDTQVAAQRSVLLQRDLASLAQVSQQLCEVAAEMVTLLDLTWGRWLRPTAVDPLRLACLVATVGDIRQYHSAGQLFGRSGLHSRCADSGTRQLHGQGERQVKPGDRHLRRQLLRFTLSMLAHYPALRAYRERLCQRGKRRITANIAVARKLTGIIYAVASREQPFEPSKLT